MDFVTDTNHESRRRDLCRGLLWLVSVTLSRTCPGLCRKIGVMEFGLISSARCYNGGNSAALSAVRLLERRNGTCPMSINSPACKLLLWTLTLTLNPDPNPNPKPNPNPDPNLNLNLSLSLTLALIFAAPANGWHIARRNFCRLRFLHFFHLTRHLTSKKAVISLPWTDTNSNIRPAPIQILCSKIYPVLV